jgi:hypothetical protein
MPEPIIAAPKDEPQPSRKIGNLRLIWSFAKHYPMQIAAAGTALVIAASATSAIPVSFRAIIDKGVRVPAGTSIGVDAGEDAARGLTVSAITNATPCVATFNADTRLKSGDRIATFGTTVNTASNGIWTLGSMEYAGNTGRLLGSRGNGASTLTNTVVAVVMDKSPFMKGHATVAIMRNREAVAVFSGTARVMGNDELLGTGTDSVILGSDATTLGTYFVNLPIATGGAAIEGPTFAVATTTGITAIREIKLRKFMYMECTAYTAGGVSVDILS